MKTVWILKKTQFFFDLIETRLVGLFSNVEELIDYVDKQIDAQEYDWEEVEIDELVKKKLKKCLTFSSKYAIMYTVREINHSRSANAMKPADH